MYTALDITYIQTQDCLALASLFVGAQRTHDTIFVLLPFVLCLLYRVDNIGILSQVITKQQCGGSLCLF